MKIAGVVLAAGASTRMGEPKAELKVSGSTFLDNMCQALIAGSCDPVAAVVREPGNLCSLTEVKLLINPNPDRGQISSLRIALDQFSTLDAIVWVLVDQGQIAPDTVRSVCMTLNDAPAVVARYRGQGGHPVGLSSDCFDLMKLPKADQGAQVIMDGLESSGQLRHLDVEDSGVTRNLNTPEDYQAFIRQVEKSRA